MPAKTRMVASGEPVVKIMELGILPGGCAPERFPKLMDIALANVRDLKDVKAAQVKLNPSGKAAIFTVKYKGTENGDLMHALQFLTAMHHGTSASNPLRVIHMNSRNEEVQTREES